MGTGRTAEETEEAVQDRAAFERCLAFVRESMPSDAEGIYGPRSITWDIMREPCILLAAPSAVLLQLAHPAIADGVSRYSSFATDYAGRARRTFTTMYDLVFGAKEHAFRAANGLHAMHVRVRGEVSEPGSSWHGRPYRANDQELLRWVSVTLPVCVNQVFHAAVRPLPRDERERLYAEQKVGAAIVGVLPETMPKTLADFEVWYATMTNGPDLHVGPKALALFDALQAGRRSLWLRTLSAAFLPPRIREEYGLSWGRRERATLFAIMRGLRLGNAVVPRALRSTFAFHQASLRVADAGGVTPSPVAVAVSALGRRVAIPTGLSP